MKSDSRRWLLDSGASSHYIKDISYFRAYHWLPQPVRVNTGKGPILGVARGEVDVVMSIGNVVIGDVLLVPDLDVPSDLLSVSALMIAGLGVTFQSGCATINKDGTKWGVASPLSGSNVGDGGLCYLEEYERVNQYTLTSQCIDTQLVEIWHRRLGHLHPRAIRNLTSMVTGVKIGDPPNVGNHNVDCVECLKGTQHQVISRFPFSKVTKPLERVSADIASPMSCPDCTLEYKYLFVFVNYFTRFIWVFPLVTRIMVLRATQIWKTNSENSCGLRLQALQTDNAGKFLGKKWTKMVQDARFNYYISAPYAPSMNSYAERVIRTIAGHASAMLWTAGIREDFWELAAKASVYLLNRSPHKGLDSTPYEKRFNKKPHLGHIRIWGCRAWAAVPKERRKKFDSRSRECILVGFYDTENLYQLWDIEAKELVKCRYVIFHEHALGHPSLTRSPTPRIDILGQDMKITSESLHDDHPDTEDLEELYPVIESLKCANGKGFRNRIFLSLTTYYRTLCQKPIPKRLVAVRRKNG